MSEVIVVAVGTGLYSQCLENQPFFSRLLPTFDNFCSDHWWYMCTVAWFPTMKHPSPLKNCPRRRAEWVFQWDTPFNWSEAGWGHDPWQLVNQRVASRSHTVAMEHHQVQQVNNLQNVTVLLLLWFLESMSCDYFLGFDSLSQTLRFFFARSSQPVCLPFTYSHIYMMSSRKLNPTSS